MSEEMRFQCLELAVRYGLSEPIKAAGEFLDFVCGRDGRRKPRSVSPDVQRRLEELAQDEGFDLECLTGARRSAQIVAARDKVIAALSTEFPGLSLPALGRMFNRDHTSIYASLRRSGAHVPGHTRRGKVRLRRVV